jgi:hypothetical protein
LKNTSPELLKINLRVLGVNKHGDMALHVDTLELTSARQRMAFCKQASEELSVKEDIVRRELGRVMLKLEQMRDEQIARALAPKAPVDTMTEEERSAAMELLRDPRLMERIVEDFARCGTVGEETNKLVGYLGAVSRHLEKPLAVIVQSSSAAGKSSLMDAVLAFVPEEQRVQYSAMTGQSLFYMGDTDLQHKVLAIVEEAGAQRASYALKLLQSEGEVSIASTGKDPVSGRHITHEYRVKGPVMIFLTTTDRHRRRTVESLPGADGERGPGANTGDPSHTTRVADYRRSAAPQGSRRVAALASQRATAAAPGDRGERASDGAELPRQHDQDATRPHEVPHAHPQHHVPASMAARSEDDDAPGSAGRIYRGHCGRRGTGTEAHP